MNPYIPVGAKILEIIKHTEIEWTFRIKCNTEGVYQDNSMKYQYLRYGESPISVSGIGKDYIDFTIRKVGKVTDEIFNYKVGDKIFLRGPYGNGFDV